ncbi:helix-turn-helix domain-containing protein [Streptomonospora nanhaiensis]|uniref:Excisionase family DNA binding protein n=1 Tax=Streptomonospora nanhaiensis TaxID=1323731 RepID=A0A853BQR9_9ACTN|nr:helix-turn-helix domain-containing protein [Streptomonospora nanhaiensis]MBV2364075.1 helix-turn-helix domain-containing protein [Streptomonospora nanhaiensis]MBX9387947.1 helix-turn-helix domain-containing protein [Streptomonospora nanhaiensis]NYI97075.1 excisionase family DNA binding protein [Streptomonospora nanhaiensis]
MNTPSAHPRFYTPGEVQRMFRVSPATVRRWAEAGHLRTARTLGGQRRIYADDVDALLTPSAAEETPRG